MKRWILFTGIVALGVAAVVVSERRKVEVQASPTAVLYLVADTEQELMRMPAHFDPMPDAEEIRIGDELAQAYSAGQEADKQPEFVVIEKYLAQVGGQVAMHAHRPLPYKFHYIPSSYLINAFALPGGHVFVGSGLLALMDSEDELAAILGHEIEHIDHYDCAQRAQQEQALRKIPLGGLVAIPIEVFEAGYTKDQELQADRDGTQLSVATGYSANGAIRMFEALQRLYGEYQSRENQGRAKTPDEEVSRVALQTIEGYFRSHPLPAERIAQVQKMIASEGWTPRAERDLAVAYIFWTGQAREALNAHKYPQAGQLASRSLKLKPDQEKALIVLAEAQFAQADFAGAAASYRKLLESKQTSDSWAQAFALALAAAEPKSAAAEFRKWLGSVGEEKPADSDVLLAGLELLAGISGPARALEQRTRQSSDDQRPRRLGELGWSYYLAGNYESAAELLGQAVQERPGDSRLWVEHTWSLIEIRRLSDAIQTATIFSDDATRAERGMAQSVAFWQAKQPDAALSDFASAVLSQPEWVNSRWVKALYSPLVAQSVQEMQAERERRRKARLAVNR
jgi:beta-barrel assembly-enhancing protease